MTIDWNLPVETTEDPPRPVRVLFNAEHLAAVGVIGDSEIIRTVRGCRIFDGEQWVNLRNVPPPKPEPVMMEGWLNLYRNGALTVHFSDDDAQVCNPNGAAETRRIAWMSDGSPVPGEASGEEAPLIGLSDAEFRRLCDNVEAPLIADRDHWKAKAEALQAEVDRQKPVVDAAVIWERHFSPLAGERLVDAVRTFLSKQAPAEPVKCCTTCWFCKPIQVGAPCVKCHDASEWRPRHD